MQSHLKSSFKTFPSICAVAPCHLTNFQKMQSHLAFGLCRLCPMCWPGRIGWIWLDEQSDSASLWQSGLLIGVVPPAQTKTLGRRKQKVQHRRAQQKIQTRHNWTKCKWGASESDLLQVLGTCDWTASFMLRADVCPKSTIFNVGPLLLGRLTATSWTGLKFKYWLLILPASCCIHLSWCQKIEPCLHFQSSGNQSPRLNPNPGQNNPKPTLIQTKIKPKLTLNQP